MGNGYITLKSALGEYMIDVNGAEDKDGANIQIFNGYGGDAQQFMVKSSEKQGAYVLATKCSDLTKVLDDSNFGKEDRSNVCQWTYGGRDNQLWNFEKISSTIDIVQEGKTSGAKPQEKVTSSENKLNLEYKIDKWNPAYQVNFKITNKTNADVLTW